MDYIYKTEPFKHQHEEFIKHREKEYHALLFEMGCGKSKVIIDQAAWLYAQGRIDALLVVAPSGVQRNWIINEIPAHMPDYIDYAATWYASQPNKKEEENLCRVINHTGLRVVAMNIEAYATEKGVSFARKFLNSFRSMMVLDESDCAKSPKAIRTKNLLKLGIHAKYRRILTGTPITQSPLDLYTQFNFLDPHILRCSSYYAFRNRYAVLQSIQLPGKPRFDKITGYQNIEELQRLIAPHSTRVTKSDCLDLPAKLYSKRYVCLSDTQRKLYNQLKKEVVAELNGKTMSAPLMLVKLGRLQQIVGGFFIPDTVPLNADHFNLPDGDKPPDWVFHASSNPEPIDKVNPRIEFLIELLEVTTDSVIIFARFRAEIDAIFNRICEKFGTDSVVQYHGGIKPDIRKINEKKFQNKECQFFVGNTKCGGRGLTLTASNLMIYYSNTFSLAERLQSEDRQHRVGTVNNVTYIDIIAENTIDETIVNALRSKKEIADIITKDEVVKWI